MSEFSKLFYKDHAHYDLLFNSFQIYHKNATTTTKQKRKKKQSKAKKDLLIKYSVPAILIE